jgi:hypothetical protein
MVGPTLWALAFCVIYALHGFGCANGWTGVALPWGNLHYTVLIATYLVALALAALTLWRIPRGEGAKAQVIGAGGWIGLGGVALTLFPVLGVSSCWP